MTRRGGALRGCLISILVLVILVYLGINAGETALRYYRFRDAMQQEARFAAGRSDDAIKRHLAAVADSLGLPDEARAVDVARGGSRIVIQAQYDERVRIAWLTRKIRFAPRAEAGF